MRCYQLCLLVSLQTHGRVLEPSNGTLATAPLVARADTHRRLSIDFKEAAKLMASGAAADDEFGYSLAIAGDTIVVGTYRGEAAYVFRTSDGGATYGQVAKLTASDAAGSDKFGYSVAIDGNTVVVGAYLNDDDGYNSGSAYVYRTSDDWDTYVELAKLTAADAAAYDYFGKFVAIDGDTIVIAAYGDDDDGSKSGSVYVFRMQDGVTVVKALSGTDCGEDDAAGRKMLVPSTGHDIAGTRCCGSIYDSFCNNDNDGCQSGTAPGYVTYEVAKATCEDAGARLCTPDELEPVSYTHLTLPTILRV